jgi:hypothetical protein
MLKKIRGIYVIASVSTLSATALALSYIKLYSLDIITLSFLILLSIIFILGLVLSILQQKIIDSEGHSGDKTLQLRFAKQINSFSHGSGFEAVHSYSGVYFQHLKRFFSTISAISSILITLGLVGTVFGLILSMSGLKAIVTSSSDSPAVLQSMTNILAGVDVSFYTTLMGSFLGGVILRINLIIHEFYATDVLTSAKLFWYESIKTRKQEQENDTSFDGMTKELLTLRKLYIELNSRISDTTKSVVNFQNSLDSLANFPAHIQLQKASEKISEASEHLKSIKVTQ